MIAGRNAPPPSPDETPAAEAPRVGEGLGLKLETLQHRVHTWNGDPGRLPEASKAAFLCAPGADMDALRMEKLLTWVEGGGTLFVSPGTNPAVQTALERWVDILPDPFEATAIPGDRMVPHDQVSWRYREVTGEERVEFSAPLQEIAVPGPLRVGDPSHENSLLFPREALGLVAEIVHGQGNIIVFPEAGMFSDEGLSSASNAALLESLVSDWVPADAEVWIQRE